MQYGCVMMVVYLELELQLAREAKGRRRGL